MIEMLMEGELQSVKEQDSFREMWKQIAQKHKVKWEDFHMLLTMEVCPEGVIECSFEDKFVSIAAQTNVAGPGFHACVASIYDDILLDSGLSFQVNDPTGYYEKRDFEELKYRYFYPWLRTIADYVLEHKQQANMLSLIHILNRYQSRIKKRLILVSGYGRPEMIMTLNTLNENFKGFIDEIITCDVFELENFSFQSNDIIITTIPVMTPNNVPVVYIQGKVEFYYKEILSLLKSEYDINCSIQRYLLRSLYDDNCSCKSSNDIIARLKTMFGRMWGETAAEKLVNNIYQLGNEVGNDIVCLHSRYDYHTPFISFISLKNHILWERNQVKYIFFMNMNAERDKEVVYHMYHLISNWAELKSRINYYAKNQSYEELIDSLDNSRL